MWNHGSVTAIKGGSFVNELEGGDPRRESHYHFTAALDIIPSLVAILLDLGNTTGAVFSTKDYANETDAWKLQQCGSVRCNGEVTAWKDAYVATIRHLGGSWAHLQLTAYTIAYPELVDAVTTTRAAPRIALGPMLEPSV